MTRLLSAGFTLGVMIVAILMTGNDTCFASGGDSWGGGYGSRGLLGGCWGSRGGGFRTPVRDFFAYRQPVRRVLRGVGGMFAYRGGYGSRGWNGYGSTGNASGGSAYGCQGGYASTGYNYYSSTGGQTFGGQVSYGSVGANLACHSTNIANCGMVNCANGFQTAATGCTDCVSGIGTVGQPMAVQAPVMGTLQDGTLQDGTIISTDQSVIPAEQYYNQGSGTGTEGDANGNVRGFDSPPAPEPATDETTAILKDSILNVNLPVDAQLYVNGRLTKTTGGLRQYVSRNLKTGEKHRFNLEAITTRDGKEVSIKKSIAMRAGRDSFVEFDFDRPVLTQLTLKLPENATVKLCGNVTKATGSVRNFKTHLQPGKVWDNYDITISYEKNGKIVDENRTIEIKAGEKYVVDFDSGSDYYVSK